MTGRRRAWGAEVDAHGARFRVLAPGRERVEVVIGDGASARAFALAPDGEPGVWSGVAPDVRAGALYRYRLSGEDAPLADPASRFQPGGVVYELHVGTFTVEGTWEAARPRTRRSA